jgi:hypothetical protein
VRRYEGPISRIMAPPRLPRSLHLQEESLLTWGAMPFGGGDGLVCLCLRAKYLPQRGHGLRRQLGHGRNRLSAAGGP